jgi:hypothetical protein
MLVTQTEAGPLIVGVAGVLTITTMLEGEPFPAQPKPYTNIFPEYEIGA